MLHNFCSQYSPTSMQFSIFRCHCFMVHHVGSRLPVDCLTQIEFRPLKFAIKHVPIYSTVRGQLRLKPFRKTQRQQRKVNAKLTLANQSPKNALSTGQNIQTNKQKPAKPIGNKLLNARFHPVVREGGLSEDCFTSDINNLSNKHFTAPSSTAGIPIREALSHYSKRSSPCPVCNGVCPRYGLFTIIYYLFCICLYRERIFLLQNHVFLLKTNTIAPLTCIVKRLPQSKFNSVFRWMCLRMTKSELRWNIKREKLNLQINFNKQLSIIILVFEVRNPS